ncbi:RagB/SusD family nutrient uptake outer membrane protein [Sphingobacterium faecale]|uniref:RagB/SusD family nutrient uptake outer membrane protein n=1 Tax=Sphingobacterium faecale TaxID=2803775 RepID=A0ABS1R7Q3_9SPHI|nr:RagB/SusD family nutrient uptake outer membrane protein [Sphingobacterium faecale]MBL1410734.1 RagB/SusD family nutrient uptake outer membrane protein [Sphingobacterium faecale]
MKILKNIILISLFLTVSSCQKWLTVEPEDRSTEDQLFSSVNGFYIALNGIYTDFTNPYSYGAAWTMTTLEILAQRYNVNQEHTSYTLANYGFQEETAKRTMESIWNKAYFQIASANNILEQIEKRREIFTSPVDYALIKGEALALRAMIHFDLVRLFGPMPAQGGDNAAIPYYIENNRKTAPILSLNQVLSKAITDLENAIELLKEDPIISKGPLYSDSQLGGDYQRRYRTLRLNYFATLGLLARVQLYAGNKPSAFQHAATVITQASTWFPFIKTENIMGSSKNPDRIFSTEILFSLQAPQRQQTYLAYFAPDLDGKNILAPLSSRLDQSFENNQNDFRYTPLWASGEASGKNYRVFSKYNNIEDSRLNYNNRIPLIRLSEMYYIAAESAENPNEGLTFLNTIRNARGLVSLSELAPEQWKSEIEKEYIKEFYGEGQLFFFFKRIGKATIPDGKSVNNINMTPSKYIVPLPESETRHRN